MENKPEFRIGQIIRHNRFHYRGVIFDIDPYFKLSDEWYDTVALSHPPKDQPWYHIMVDKGTHTTYVAERHLKQTTHLEQIEHPMLGSFFKEFINGCYIPHQLIH